ncbi:MAG: response regulator transcription factor [Eubacteriales bacterium]|nr:response regulator transcription factor [Eubacteriales bacterium]
MGYQILAADGEPELLDTLERYLHREKITLRRAGDGLEALELFEMREPHLVLLDIWMPGMDGLSVLSRIRRNSVVPAILLTTRRGGQDTIRGLELGADDCIAKPCMPLEVVARIKAQLRRNYDYQNAGKETKLRQFDLVLDKRKQTVTKRGRRVPLTRTEFGILKLLMLHPGHVHPKRQIKEYVWPSETFVSDDTLMVHICKIRGKIEDIPGHPQLLKTVKGVGYKFERETSPWQKTL